MSHYGKLWRGLKWNRHRNAEGELEKGIALDEIKFNDLNYYLNFIKGKDKKKIDAAIIEWEHYVKQSPSIAQQKKMKEIKEILSSEKPAVKSKKSR